MGGDGSRADSGQILVIAGLLLAVLFVGLALVLNGAIYAENMATRETRSSADPVAEADETATRLQRAAEEANWNRDDLPYSDRRLMVEDSVTAWDRNMGGRGARQGMAVSTRLEATTEGVRVTQSQPGDFMTANEEIDQEFLDMTIDPLGLGDRTNWLVAPDVKARAFKVGVNRSDLKAVDQGFLGNLSDLLDELLTGSDVFWIEIQEGSVTWRVYLFQVDNEGEVATVVTSDDGSETVEGVCTVEGDWATVDIQDGKLRGDETVDCPSLSFYESLGSHDMYWVGADEVNGTYHFIADKPENQFRAELENEYTGILDGLLTLLSFDASDVADRIYGRDGNPHPFTTSAVYDATLSFKYNDGGLQYERNITVTGG